MLRSQSLRGPGPIFGGSEPGPPNRLRGQQWRRETEDRPSPSLESAICRTTRRLVKLRAGRGGPLSSTSSALSYTTRAHSMSMHDEGGMGQSSRKGVACSTTPLDAVLSDPTPLLYPWSTEFSADSTTPPEFSDNFGPVRTDFGQIRPGSDLIRPELDQIRTHQRRIAYRKLP